VYSLWREFRGGFHSWQAKQHFYPKRERGQCVATQKSFSAADPAIVPVEGPVASDGNLASGREGGPESRVTTAANPYGQNNEQLPERLESALRRLIPEEASRTKQYREIAQLVGEMPVVHRQDVTAAAGPAAAAASPSGVDAEVIVPSSMRDEFADNHTVELEICMRWFSSDAGQVEEIEAPLGYTNVRADALFHRAFLRKQQAAARAATRVQSQLNTARRR
jgi:hypothetical protein